VIEMENHVCLFCGGVADEPDHLLRCDGRQGAIEAAEDPAAALYADMGDVPFERGSATSAAAAGALEADRLAELERLVYQTIAADPHTCDEVETITGLPHQTASARIRGLVLRDRLIDSGVRRRTRRNRAAVVWTIAEGRTDDTQRE
jgi:hypothetical protein